MWYRVSETTGRSDLMGMRKRSYGKKDHYGVLLWRSVWVFDHSSCYAAMADDALDVNTMNVKAGGK